MPCDTVQTASVELKNADKNLLAIALDLLDIRNWTYQENVLTIKGMSKISGDLLSKIKQEYSTQIVLSQAKRFGWQMKEIAPKQWEVIRR